MCALRRRYEFAEQVSRFSQGHWQIATNVGLSLQVCADYEMFQAFNLNLQMLLF